MYIFLNRYDNGHQLCISQTENLRQGFNECCGQIGMVNVMEHYCEFQSIAERSRRLHFSLLQCDECKITADSFLELCYHKLRLHRGILCRMCALCRRVYEHEVCFNEHPCCANGFHSFETGVEYMYGNGSIL